MPFAEHEGKSQDIPIGRGTGRANLSRKIFASTRVRDGVALLLYCCKKSWEILACHHNGREHLKESVATAGLKKIVDCRKGEWM
jgi:hypothetical protein